MNIMEECGIIRKIYVDNPKDRPDLICLRAIIDMERGGRFNHVLKSFSIRDIKLLGKMFDFAYTVDTLCAELGVSKLEDINDVEVVCTLADFNLLLNIDFNSHK